MPNLIVAARSALLDALEALREQRDAVVVVGAQAVYLRCESSVVAVAEATKDSDLAIDPRVLNDEPLLERAMARAGFTKDLTSGQPGAWLNPAGIPVDLMVPDGLSGPGGNRGGRIPPHSRSSTRKAVGLEACVVDHGVVEIPALDPDDRRRYAVRVAGCSGLIVAKLHKLHERLDQPNRLNDKDAHDVYRMLQVLDVQTEAATFARLLNDDVSAAVTTMAVDWLHIMFGSGPEAIGSVMAGRAEEGVGDPELAAVSAALLAAELTAAIGAVRE